MTYDKVKYNTEYNKINYTELRFRVVKGQKEIIDYHWKSKGYKSFSAYMNDLIAQDMERTGEKQGIHIQNSNGVVIGGNNNNGIVIGDIKGNVNM